MRLLSVVMTLVCAFGIVLRAEAQSQSVPANNIIPARTNANSSYSIGDTNQYFARPSQPSPSDRPVQSNRATIGGMPASTPIIRQADEPTTRGTTATIQDVPNPPATGNQQPVGPALSVQSNASAFDDANCSWCNLGQPFRLFGTTRGGLTVGGWLESGYYSDDDGLFNVHDDRTRLVQGWIYADKKANRCCNWDFGYHFDLVYGVDAQELQAIGNPPAGNPDGWDNDLDHGIYGWAIPQAYGEIARGNLSIIGGKFFGPLGYESLMSPKNFFFSHSYSRFYIQPFSMTGGLTTFDYSSDLTLFNGVTAGWDTGFEQFGSGMTYVGGFAYKPCAPINVTYMVSAGNTGYRGTGWTNNLIIDLMLTDKINYVIDANTQNLDSNDQYGLVNYVTYRVNPCLAFGSRFEWFVSDRFTGRDNSTYSWTSGLNFRRNANFLVRPELRVDWGAGAVDPGNLIFANDLIITF